MALQTEWRATVEHLRSELRAGRVSPAVFSAALEAVSAQERDAWLDLIWGGSDIPVDEPELPRGCVPYLPCAVASVLAAIGQAAVTSEDVFVDVGAGTGRAALLAHLSTGARCVGLEIQPALVASAQQRAAALSLKRLSFVRGDATESIRFLPRGTVFFLYCPFSGEHLRHFLSGLESVARTRPIRVCCVDMAPLDAPWLTRVPALSLQVDVYRSALP